MREHWDSSTKQGQCGIQPYSMCCTDLCLWTSDMQVDWNVNLDALRLFKQLSRLYLTVTGSQSLEFVKFSLRLWSRSLSGTHACIAHVNTDQHRFCSWHILRLLVEGDQSVVENIFCIAIIRFSEFFASSDRLIWMVFLHFTRLFLRCPISL